MIIICAATAIPVDPVTAIFRNAFNVIPLKIPPLRERVEDIPPLIDFFLRQFNKKCGTEKSVSPEVVDCLRRYSFPGNIRELANLIEQLVVLTPTDHINLEDLPIAVREKDWNGCLLPATESDLTKVLREVEKQMIVRAKKSCGSQR